MEGSEGSRQHRPQPFTWQNESNPEGLPGFKIPVKERLVKFDAKGPHSVLPHSGERTSVVSRLQRAYAWRAIGWLCLASWFRIPLYTLS